VRESKFRAFFFNRRQNLLGRQRFEPGTKFFPTQPINRAIVRNRDAVLGGKPHDLAGDGFKLGILGAAQHHVLGHARHAHGAHPTLEQPSRQEARQHRNQMKKPEWRHAGDTMLAIAGRAHDLHAFPQNLGEELLVDGEI
jgi:hypothetical protein